jgi:hypothetical protein
MQLFWVSLVHNRVSGFVPLLMKSEGNLFAGKRRYQMNRPPIHNFLSSLQPREVRIAGSSAILRIFGSCEDWVADHRKVILEEQKPFVMAAEDWGLYGII